MTLTSRLLLALSKLRKRGCHPTRIELSNSDIAGLRDENNAGRGSWSKRADGYVMSFRGVPVYEAELVSGIPVIGYEVS